MEEKKIESNLNSNEIVELTKNLAELSKETTDKNLEVPISKKEDRPSHYNRKQRRQIHNFVEKRKRKVSRSSNLNLKEWSEKIRLNQQNGKIFQEKYDTIIKNKHESFYLSKEKEIRVLLKEKLNYSKESIDIYIEKWYDNLKLWKEEATY